MQRGKQATTKLCTQQNSKLTTHPIRENKNIDSTFNQKKNVSREKKRQQQRKKEEEKMKKDEESYQNKEKV